MPIRLDEPTPGGGAPDLTALRDAVRAAETAVRHWDGELARRVKDAQALDGMILGALTSLLGTREARIEAAVAAVKEAQARLAQARKTLERARAELGVGEGRARELADAEAERTMARELLADAIRGTDHPAAGELGRLEAAITSTKAELETRTEALQAALGLLGATRAALRGAGRAAEAAFADAVDQPFGELQKLASFHQLGGDLAGYRQKAERLEHALGAIGIEWRAGGKDDAPPSLFETAALDGLFFEFRHLDRVTDLQGRFVAIREELQLLVEGLERERKQRATAVEALEGERRRLLESHR